MFITAQYIHYNRKCLKAEDLSAPKEGVEETRIKGYDGRKKNKHKENARV